MRKNTQKITKPDTENVDFGTPFGTHVPPCPANAPSFCDLALGTCPLVTQGVICMVFWLDSGAILVTFGTHVVTKCQSIQVRIHPV